jgi:NDP-sugar pyrophosphorylase family protein
VHILEQDIFRYIPEGRFYEINDQVYPKAIKDGARILAFPVEGYWNDVGDPARYLEAQKDLLLKNSKETTSRRKSATWISKGAEVAETANLGPFTSLGPHSIVESHATVENSILWEDVHVKSGANVLNCIAGSGVTLEGDVRDMIVTRHGKAPIIWKR